MPEVMGHEQHPVLGHPVVARAARWGIVAWAAIGVVSLVIGVFVFVIQPIRIIFPPLIVAMIVVYILNPLVSMFERRGFRRVWGSLIVYVVFATVVGTALYLLVPVVTNQVSEFIGAAPRILGRLSAAVGDFAQRFGVGFEEGAPAVPSETILGFLGRLVSITQGIVELAIIFVLGPILAFYFLVDLPKIKRALRSVIPARRRPEIERVLQNMGRAVGGFFRGQLMVAAFVGVASSIALWIVGLPFWALVGLATGLFNLIPLIGPFIGGAIAVLIAFTTGTSEGVLALEPGWPLALGASIALLIVQQIDNHIISPNIVGRTVRIHPVTVMLGLLVGGTLMGLLGMILAIPVIASVKILFLHYWDTRMTWPPRGPDDAGLAPPGDRTEEPEPGSGRLRPRDPAPGWVQTVRGLFARRGDGKVGEPEPAATGQTPGSSPPAGPS